MAIAKPNLDLRRHSLKLYDRRLRGEPTPSAVPEPCGGPSFCGEDAEKRRSLDSGANGLDFAFWAVARLGRSSLARAPKRATLQTDEG
jgi:hypothetical protein